MNRMVVVLACWLLLLTGLPCPDADCHAHDLTTHSQSADAGRTDDHKAPCSPFCHCTACSGFSLPAPTSSPLPAVDASVLPASPVFTYRSPALPDVVRGIWQPPQLRY